MRSKSYYATVVGSSFLLLAISCMAQGTRVEEKKADVPAVGMPPVGSDDSGSDTKGIALGDGGSGFQAMLPVAGTGGPAIAHLPDHIQQQVVVEEPHELQCPTGEMDFEGKCVNKIKVDKVLDKRKKKALDRVKAAKKPKQTADASYDLLEQNTAQVDKMEDDLDEIIEQLQQEKKEEELDKKGGRP
jgi:hypothetical protein